MSYAPQRDPQLYNKEIATRFRAEAKSRTWWWSSDRRFLNRLADVLDGGLPQGDGSIEADRDYLLISTDQQRMPRLLLVERVCKAVPGLTTESVTLGVYLGIRYTRP